MTLKHALVAAALSTLAAGALAQTPLTTTRIAVGFTKPVVVISPPGDFSRLFIVEKTGKIRIMKNGQILATPFLDVSSLINSTTLEWGLLTMCFDPDYANNGHFYLNYNAGTGGDTVISRFTVTADPDVADINSRFPILFLQQPNANHRGATLEFGPDGYLYDSQGDGGGQNDPNQRAQNLAVLQGKMLRLDVHGPDDFPADPNNNYHVPASNPFVGQAGVRGEIWDYGLRNPWRFCFDRGTGDLWIADVGQNQREEIDFEPAGFAGGRNYGWRCTDGTFCTGLSGCTCNGPTLTPPIHEYNHTVGQSITGGYVYRGCAIPDLSGTYFFADYQTSKIFSLRYNGTTVTDLVDRTVELDPPGTLSILNISSFGQDAYGEIYLCDYNGGEIFKIIPRTPAAPDCNTNGVADACEILSGAAADVNNDGVPDSCQCLELIDFDGDGFVTGVDYDLFVQAFEAGETSADFNGDGFITGVDFDLYVQAFEQGC